MRVLPDACLQYNACLKLPQFKVTKRTPSSLVASDCVMILCCISCLSASLCVLCVRGRISNNNVTCNVRKIKKVM